MGPDHEHVLVIYNLVRRLSVTVTNSIAARLPRGRGWGGSQQPHPVSHSPHTLLSCLVLSVVSCQHSQEEGG